MPVHVVYRRDKMSHHAKNTVKMRIAEAYATLVNKRNSVLLRCLQILAVSLSWLIYCSVINFVFFWFTGCHSLIGSYH